MCNFYTGSLFQTIYFCYILIFSLTDIIYTYLIHFTLHIHCSTYIAVHTNMDISRKTDKGMLVHCTYFKILHFQNILFMFSHFLNALLYSQSFLEIKFFFCKPMLVLRNKRVVRQQYYVLF